jgi:succinate dehydrogenase / fumarate reductase flavoprotein subunit
MKIFPSVHYTMGGLWTTYESGSYRPETPHGAHQAGGVPPVDAEPGRGMQPGHPSNMMTNVSGLYAFGEVNFAYHGATRLGANALLSCIFDGLFCGPSVVNYVRDGLPSASPAAEMEQALFDRFADAESAKVTRLLGSAGGEPGQPGDDTNPYMIAKELGEEMTAASTVVKTGERLGQCLERLAGLRERFDRVRLLDSATWTNQTLSFTRALGDMLILAELIAKAGLLREESRGSHFRLDFPERNDERFLRASVGRYDPADGEHHVDWREVRTDLVRPRARTYGKTEKKEAAPAATATP